MFNALRQVECEAGIKQCEALVLQAKRGVEADGHGLRTTFVSSKIKNFVKELVDDKKRNPHRKPKA